MTYMQTQNRPTRVLWGNLVGFGVGGCSQTPTTAPMAKLWWQGRPLASSKLERQHSPTNWCQSCQPLVGLRSQKHTFSNTAASRPQPGPTNWCQSCRPLVGPVPRNTSSARLLLPDQS